MNECPLCSAECIVSTGIDYVYPMDRRHSPFQSPIVAGSMYEANIVYRCTECAITWPSGYPLDWWHDTFVRNGVSLGYKLVVALNRLPHPSHTQKEKLPL